MTAILGISAYYHDAAAALVVDGEIVAAAHEERFTRIKHDPSFPINAIAYCLGEAGLTPEQLDHVGFYEKPLLKFDRLLETYLAYAPAGFRSFVKAMPVWLKQKLHLPREMRRALGGYSGRFVFTSHHESHAASAFFPSPFEHAAILTSDGVGEWSTATIGEGRGNRVELREELRFPHSLGLLYSALTYFCGFKVNSGEYKLMGLAPYGEPEYADLILEQLIDLKQDGSFRMEMSYFNYCQGLTMTSPRFDQLIGGPPRQPESPLTEREMNLAASIQQVSEEIMLRMARHAQEITGATTLCLAGGVALNCVANERIQRDGPFDEIWIQPAAGDAGGALGVALFIWHQLLERPREAVPGDSQKGSLLGPAFPEEEIGAFLERVGATYRHFDDEAELLSHLVDQICDEKVLGFFQGRMEYGPRALGSRSIVGDPRSAEMQKVMNLKIKFRESFRPFAPSVLEERVGECFDVGRWTSRPYMLMVADVVPEQRLDLEQGQGAAKGLDKLKVLRSKLPAITHVNYSARMQTVDKVRHGRYHRLLTAFYERTGCPTVINTSFNVRGEPIVCRPQEAYQCFMATEMDVLALEGYVLHKSEQSQRSPEELERYLAQFELD
jgi:carbamoyltransferase